MVAIAKKSLLPFADDMISRTKSFDYAKAIMNGMDQLKKFSLEIKKSKYKILAGPTSLKGL